MDSEGSPRLFKTTRWSVVSRAVGPDDADAREALSAFCNAYWYPLYAYIRRSGKSPHDAEDLTQGFFARVVEKEILSAADRDKGKLRTFLLACVRNYLANEHERGMAQKRGAAVLVRFDPGQAEKNYAAEPVDDLSPDRMFQRRWAMSILEHSMQLLAEEFARSGKTEVFEALRPFLGMNADQNRQYPEISAELGITVGTLKNLVFRMRKRWRDILFEEVAKTLDDPTPETIRAELAELLGCV